MRRNLTYKGYNWSDVETSFRKELLGEHCAGRVKKAAVQILFEAQKDFVKSLPSHEAPEMPFITGNLHDSIVSVITDKGRVLRATYTDPVAVNRSVITGRDIFRPQRSEGKRVIGSLSAFNAVKRLQRGAAPNSLACTMSVNVPYAENPNEFGPTNIRGAHVGYLDILAIKYAKTLERGFKLYDYSQLFKFDKSSITWDTPILRGK